MTAPPSPLPFWLGLLDVVTAIQLWRVNIQGWRYGVLMSLVIVLAASLFLPNIIVLRHDAMSILAIEILLFSAAELIVLITPGVRQHFGVQS